MNRTMSKVLYKVLAAGASALGGVLAGLALQELWKRIGDDKEAPHARDLTRSSQEVLVAAAMQGAVFAVVQAAVDRAGERGYRALTAKRQ